MDISTLILVYLAIGVLLSALDWAAGVVNTDGDFEWFLFILLFWPAVLFGLILWTIAKLFFPRRVH